MYTTSSAAYEGEYTNPFSPYPSFWQTWVRDKAANATISGWQLNTYQDNRFIVPPKSISCGFRAKWNWVRMIVLQISSGGGGQGDTKTKHTLTHHVIWCLRSQPSTRWRSPPTLHMMSSPGCYQWNMSWIFSYFDGTKLPLLSCYRDLCTQAQKVWEFCPGKDGHFSLIAAAHELMPLLRWKRNNCRGIHTPILHLHPFLITPFSSKTTWLILEQSQIL